MLKCQDDKIARGFLLHTCAAAGKIVATAFSGVVVNQCVSGNACLVDICRCVTGCLPVPIGGSACKIAFIHY